MKKNLLVSLFAVSALILSGCSDDKDVDNQKPVVKIISPSEDEVLKPGSEIQFDVELSDNDALAAYKVNIHGAFDGHTHSDTRSEEVDDTEESVEFSRNWTEADFVKQGETPIIGKNSVHIQHSLMTIPETVSIKKDGVTKDMPLKEGHYHIIVYCTDKSGNESFEAKDIVISYDGEDHDHVHEH